MSDPIRNAAFFSVARGCGFGGLATFTAMAGSAFDLVLALKLGGYCWLLTTAILMLMASRAPQKRYKETELWVLLPVSDRPPPVIAQRVIGNVRQEVLRLFAFWTCCASILHLAAALLLELFGLP